MQIPSELKNTAAEFFGEAEVVATLDHIFSCPPLRLFDSHTRLLQMPNVFPLLWDINMPNLRRYKSELVLDGVILNTNSPEYQIFSADKLSALSEVKQPDLPMLQKDFAEAALRTYQGDKHSRQLAEARMAEICNFYASALADNRQSSSNFYQGFLANLYAEFGQEQLSSFVQQKMQSMFNSGIATEFVARVIEQAEGNESFLSVLQNSNVFKPPYFRPVNVMQSADYANIESVTSNLNEVLQQLREQRLLPSLTVFHWATALCGLKHFGNDHGVHQRLQEYSQKNYASLQLTAPKQDGRGILSFAEPTWSWKKVSQSKYQKGPTKASRSMNVVAAWLHLGKAGLQQTVNTFLSTRKEQELVFAKLIE